MSRSRSAPLVVVTVLVVAAVIVVAALAMAALPVVLALVLGVVALVAGTGARRRGHRTHAGSDRGGPAPRTPPLRWVARWETRPSVDALPGTRGRAAVVLAEWGVSGEAAEPALLVLTELLSNAVEHGRGPRWLALELADDVVRIEVRDDAPEPPRPSPLDPERPRGRGLQIVDALSVRWGWTDDLPGKVVWASVPTRWRA